MIPFPNKRYSIILSDPPWSYRDKCHAGKRGAAYKYDVMTIADIKSLPLHQISAPDCALFLWVTAPLLHEGLEVMRAWGFEFKTIAFTWIKTTKHGSVAWGMGNWTRANAEYCLLGIKGKPKRVSASVHSVIHSERREHSRKPDEARERIMQLMGDVSRIELFARQNADGWDAWGLEVPV